MRRRVWVSILIIISVGTGLIVLSGYFFPSGLLSELRAIFLNWFVVISALAFIAGGIRVLSLHWKTIQRQKQGVFFSWVLLVSMIATVTISMIYGQVSAVTLWIMNYLVLPVEISLVAILAVFLIYALSRLFARRQSVFTATFIGTCITLLGLQVASSWVSNLWVSELSNWIRQIWSLGAIRAILIGVALGAITTGLRVLMGSDRPYESG